MERDDNKKKGNAFVSIIETFNKFTSHVKKNGLLITFMSLLMFLIAYSWILNPVDINDMAKAVIQQQKIEHDKEVKKRLAIDDYLPTFLERCRLKYDVDRVCFFELHNNTKSITNAAYLYFSCQYEDYDRKDSTMYSIKDNYQYQRTGEYNQLMKLLKENEYIYISHLTEYLKRNQYSILKRLHRNDVESVLFIPIKNDLNYPIAIIVLTSRDSEMNIDKIKTEITKNNKIVKDLFL